MNKLERLIAKLCPNGVEYRPLGEVATINRGVRVVRAQLNDSGQYPVYQNSIKPLGFHTECNCKANTAFVIAAGAAGEVGYSNVSFWAADDCYYILPKEGLGDRFVYYCLMSKQNHLSSKVRKASIPRLARQFVESLEIPLPPLAVQEEIVRMLDGMTGLIGELERELAARKQQYEFYRDKLLKMTNGGGGYDKLTLGEVGRVAMCKRILKHQTSPVGDVPFYKIGTFGRQPDAYISRELFQEYRAKYSYPTKGAILLSAAGTIGRTVVFDGEESYYQDSNIVWLEHDESKVLNGYLKYWYQLNPWKVAKGGTIERLYNDNLLQAEIVVPPLAEQKRIVARLEGFDKLCHSMTEGLPGEIALRKRQYEFYRERLLDFRRAERGDRRAEHGSQDGERGFQDGEHGSQDGERGFQDGEHGFQDGEYGSQDGEHERAAG